MEEVTLLLCGSERNLYGKQIVCDRRYHHPYQEKHRAISAGKPIYWDGAPSIDIAPRTVPAPAHV